MGNHILILGATGKTGRLTASELVRSGQQVVIAGRDPRQLASMAGGLDVAHEKIDIRDGDALESLFKRFDAVINCIGPFAKLGYVPAEAAIRAKVHLVDSSWEQAYFHELHSFDEAAASGGIAIMPGLGVSPGVSDLLVSLACEGFEELERVTIHYVEGMANRFSYGTLHSTAQALKSTAFGYRGGELVPMATGSSAKRVDFGGNFGSQRLVAYPGGDIVIVPRRLPVDRVEHYLGLEATTVGLRLLRALPGDADSALVRAICSMATRLQYLVFWGHRGFAVSVEIEGTIAGAKTTRKVRGESSDDPYAVTAKLLALGATHLAQGESKQTGVVSPGQILDAARTLADIGVSVDR